MKKLGFFEKLFYWFNVVVALLLLVSFILPFIPPLKFPLISLLSLCVSPLILLNCIFFVYWLIRLKRQFWLSFIIVVIAHFHFNSFFFAQSSMGDTASYAHSLKLLSFNVRLFNVYESTSTRDSFNKFVKLIEEENPDIVFVQEYIANDHIKLKKYPYQYIHFKQIKIKGKVGLTKLGHAIFSKFPLLNKGTFNFEKTNNNALYADVVKGQDTIRLYNLHLNSMGITPSVESLQKGDTERVLKRMKSAFQKQEQQSKLILGHKTHTKNKVIIAGDFNNTAFSYIYRLLQAGMKDSYVERGYGVGTTFSFDGYPLRIDYILSDKTFEVIDFKSKKSKYSDHYPIVSTLAW